MCVTTEAVESQHIKLLGVQQGRDRFELLLLRVHGHWPASLGGCRAMRSFF
jgi:hypothetical protein